MQRSGLPRFAETNTRPARKTSKPWGAFLELSLVFAGGVAVLLILFA